VLPGNLAFSRDGSRLYLFASGRLIPDVGSDGSDGMSNLYLADETGLRFLAALPNPTPVASSHDGGAALLATRFPLDGDDTDERADVYRYDRDAGAFAWLSRGPGENGQLDADIPSFDPLEDLSVPAPNTFSADGQRAFFTTKARLNPADVNEKVDVYEWASGAVELISSGTAAGDAEFFGATADGKTVFFRTSASLLPADRDGGEHDVYAARIGGGFDERSPSGGEAVCGDCRRPAGGPLVRPALKSLGPGKGRGRSRLRLRRLPAGTARRVAEEGEATAIVVAPEPGLVRVRGRVDLGGGGSAIAHGLAGAVRAGELRVLVRFPAIVQRRLRSGLSVQVEFVLRQGEARTTRFARLRLERGRR
jgi:hypothetical protein